MTVSTPRTTAPLDFNFKWVVRPGSDSPRRMRERGQVNELELLLANANILRNLIVDASLDENLLSITIEDPESGPLMAGIEIHDGKATQVFRELNIQLSQRLAQQEIEELREKNDDSPVTQVVCPKCRATINLIGEYSPQCYCRHCQTLFTGENESDSELVAVECDYGICERCQMYSRPRNFTVFFFYFVVYFGGVHHKNIRCCPACSSAPLG